MTITDALRDVKFVVGSDGQPTAAVVDIAAWHQLVDLLEEAEDQGVIRAYLLRRRTHANAESRGLISWERAEAMLDANEGPHDAPVD